MLGRFAPLAASLVLGLIWSLWHYPLYYASVFATVAGALNFTVSVLCFGIQLTVLWAFTRASVFWAIVLHWTINVSDGVARAVFPDVRPPSEGDWLQLGLQIVATGVVVLLVGRARLLRKLAEALGTLGPEAVAADRGAAGVPAP